MKYSKKRITRKRRTYRRKKLSVPRRFPNTNAMVRLSRTFNTATWQFNTVNTTDFWKYFEPTMGNGFNNFAEFASVFDRYRVSSMKVVFRPRFDNVAAPVTGATPMTIAKPYMCIVKDPTTTLAPTGTYTNSSLNVLLEQGGKIYDATKPITVWWKPKIQVPTNIGSGVYYRSPPYLRTNDTSTPMRGFHAFLYQNGFGNLTTDMIWDIFITTYVTFKNLK